MAGFLVPTTCIVEMRQFVFTDDDQVMYDVSVFLDVERVIGLTVEVTRSGESRCRRASVSMQSVEAIAIAAALDDLCRATHVEGRFFLVDDDRVEIGRRTNGSMMMRLPQTVDDRNEIDVVSVPLDVHYAFSIERALKDFAGDLDRDRVVDFDKEWGIL